MAADLAAESAPSPLEEIERRVQDRAKELTLDLRTLADRSSLRRLVEDEVAEWGAQHQRGLRPFALADPEMVADRVLRNLAGYAPLEPLLRYHPRRQRRHAERRHADAATAHRASQQGSAAAPLPHSDNGAATDVSSKRQWRG